MDSRLGQNDSKTVALVGCPQIAVFSVCEKCSKEGWSGYKKVQPRPKTRISTPALGEGSDGMKAWHKWTILRAKINNECNWPKHLDI